MIDHIGLRTQNFDALAAFYEAALAPLGYSRLVSFEGGAGFGADGAPPLWLGATQGAASSIHLALRAPSRAAVDAFHAASIARGAKDNGAPGLRTDYAPTYYAAFVIDPDGNNLEAVCHAA
jgi:catechol 2,3-dioxygenase-like lactoylglutathione lyase family enzyme